MQSSLTNELTDKWSQPVEWSIMGINGKPRDTIRMKSVGKCYSVIFPINPPTVLNEILFYFCTQ